MTENEDYSKKQARRGGACGQCLYQVSRIVCSKPAVDPTTIYYEDTFNDEPWECTFGTTDMDGIWVNLNDKIGSIMSSLVWVLISYSVVTVTLLAQHHRLSGHISVIYGTICALALASHAKTMFTDPGSIPNDAVPLAVLFEQGITTHAMCSHCQTYKPPKSHHCRICNRCVSRMDRKLLFVRLGLFFCLFLTSSTIFLTSPSADHCPWMNNCVGAGNLSKLTRFGHH